MVTNINIEHRIKIIPNTPGQMPDSLHAFVGSVGLAGMDGSLWAVEGGNK